MNIDYDRFTRVLTRCVEVATDPAQPPILASVYKAMAEEKITTFLSAAKKVDTALTAFTKENREALKALDTLDAPYRVARAAVLAVLPETVLPDALKSQRTDTDKLNAIERLLDLIDDHAGQPWADNLLQGELGQKAPAAVKEINEAITAGKDRVTALTARAAAYGPAYEAYLAFKRVVRNACGPGSKEYRRIHLRASPGSAGKAEAGADATDGEPAPTGEAGAGNTVSTPPGGGAPEPAPGGQNENLPA